jgi:EPS-associated MarR family transcriptional regulator|tara:strand:+ start:118 stop:423 length:306 start_codon:yes stop_codon:yes gene_type:complete
MAKIQDQFEILRKIDKSKKSTQRSLSNQLGFSLGKLNYCLKKLKEHGLIRMKRFNDSENKLNYMYVLTPRGMRERTKLTVNYMKQKMKEYDELKKELNKKN